MVSCEYAGAERLSAVIMRLVIVDILIRVLAENERFFFSVSNGSFNDVVSFHFAIDLYPLDACTI